jgi:hypothetical protein
LQLNLTNFPAFLKDVWAFKKRAGVLQGAGHYAYAQVAGLLAKAKFGN